MRLSISSVVTTNLLSTILILLFCLLYREGIFRCRSGLRAGVVLLIGLIVRTVLPVEFFYTKSIYFTTVFTTIRTILTLPITLWKYQVSLYQVMIVIWILVSAVLFARQYRLYLKIKQVLILCETAVSPEIRRSVENVSTEYPELRNVKVCMLRSVSGPMLFGIWEKYILLPQQEYTSKELCMILEHEAIHIRQKDMLWKALIDLMVIIYWWNPAFHLLKNILFDMIEINIDLILTEGAPAEKKRQYMRCIERAALEKRGPDGVGALGFASDSTETLKRRFYYIVHGMKENKRKRVFLCCMMGLVMFGASCVVFEPQFPVPEGTEVFSDENTYIICRDGKYDVYLKGEYLLTEESLEYYPFVTNIIMEEKDEEQ